MKTGSIAETRFGNKQSGFVVLRGPVTASAAIDAIEQAWAFIFGHAQSQRSKCPDFTKEHKLVLCNEQTLGTFAAFPQFVRIYAKLGKLEHRGRIGSSEFVLDDSAPDGSFDVISTGGYEVKCVMQP